MVTVCSSKMNALLVLGLVLVGSVYSSGYQGPCESDFQKCTPEFSGFEFARDALNKYSSDLIDKSYHYLVLSSVFDKYDLDRPGFQKLYRKISDDAWNDAIELIKYQSRRGAAVKVDKPVQEHTNNIYQRVVKANELESLKMSMDYETILANQAHAIHKSISHAQAHHYDPDVAHYMEEEIIEEQSGVIRKLAGYIQNLKGIINEEKTKWLGIHLFDEYLEKAE